MAGASQHGNRNAGRGNSKLMCGIAGSIGKDKISQQRIIAVEEKLSKRGPDASGSFQDEIGNKCAITLIHTRLSIIDLNAHANQPFIKGNIHLVFNGEIYNYKELAEELKTLGANIATNSDTEVLCEAYRYWGASCLEKLEGMWAFALYDSNAGKLLLCRDRFGEKPLFYKKQSNTVYFASEPKALSKLTGEKLTPNYRHVKKYLTNGFRSIFKNNETFFEGVYEVPAASFFEINDKLEIKQSCYWVLQHNEKEYTNEQILTEAKERLVNALKIRMRSDVPLAFCLSGGVDSTALVSLASKYLNKDVYAFSVIDKDKRYNELENIQTTIDELGIKNHFAYTSTNGFLDRMERIVNYHDAPVPTISYYVHNFLSEKISELGYKVAVSGTAADEIFTGYYDHYSFWLAGQIANDNTQHDALIAEWKQSYGKWVNNPLLQDPLRFQKEPEFRQHLYQNREVFNSFLIEPTNDDFYEEQYSSDLLRNRMMNELKHEVVPVILRADDMNSMMYSVENRSPYLDRSLVEFLYSVKNKALIQDGYPKWILREIIAGIAPEKVRTDRQKKGFNASINSLVDKNDPSTKERLLSEGIIFDIVKKQAIEDFFKNDMNDNSSSKYMFNFISTKMFLENYA